jgi:hypothetical protein
MPVITGERTEIVVQQRVELVLCVCVGAEKKEVDLVETSL